MDPEAIMLSQRNKSEKDKYHMISLTCGILKKNKQTHTYESKQMVAKEEGVGAWKLKEKKANWLRLFNKTCGKIYRI